MGGFESPLRKRFGESFLGRGSSTTLCLQCNSFPFLIIKLIKLLVQLLNFDFQLFSFNTVFWGNASLKLFLVKMRHEEIYKLFRFKVLTFHFQRNIIVKNYLLKVIDMNLALSSASKYFFKFSVVFYFGYAYFAMEKLLVRAPINF